MTVDRAFRAGNFRGAGHDMVDVLSLPQPFRDDLVGLVEFLFVERCALACIRQERLVLGLSGGGTIVEVRKAEDLFWHPLQTKGALRRFGQVPSSVVKELRCSERWCLIS